MATFIHVFQNLLFFPLFSAKDLKSYLVLVIVFHFLHLLQGRVNSVIPAEANLQNPEVKRTVTMS